MASFSTFAELRDKAATTVCFLTFEARREFVRAVQPCGALDEVPEPYQSWIRDKANIPQAQLSLMHGGGDSFSRMNDKAVEADMTKVRRNAIDTALAALADLPEVEAGRIAVPWLVAERVLVPTADWADATLDTYQIEQLFATQATLKIDNVVWHLEHLGTADVGRNAHPNITLVDGEPRIHDGHHRLAALWLLGVVFANCWTLEA